MLGPQFSHVLAAARTGAEWAWTSIYNDLAPSLIGYVRARGTAEPEDVVGEIFLQVVRDLPRFVGDERDFRAWVFVIAHHRLLDAGRRRSRRPVELTPDPPEGRSSSPASDEQSIDRIASAGVRRVIAQLPPDQRDVLLLRILGDLTVEETADAVGKSSGAVKALQRRGLEALKRSISDEAVTLRQVPALTEVTWDRLTS
jgi:RNA polymerase sigma factor (sigma-70 family)